MSIECEFRLRYRVLCAYFDAKPGPRRHDCSIVGDGLGIERNGDCLCLELSISECQVSAQNTRYVYTYSYLISSIGLREVPDPFDGIVAALLENLQESDEQARRREHENLKVNGYWRTGPSFLMRRRCARHIRRESYVRLPLYSRNPPDYRIVRWIVFRFAERNFRLNCSGIEWRRDLYNDIACVELGRESRPNVYRIFDARLAVLFYDRGDFEWQVDICCGAIAHQFEFAIGRDERNGTVVVEFA